MYNSGMRLLDLFCGAGGCAVGYWRAGFTVTGMDAQDQPRFPKTLANFVKGNALTFLENPKIDLDAIDVITASPPCQRYSRAIGANVTNHHDLIPRIRELLESTGKPYVIENVPGSPLIHHKTVQLCGTAFGLGDLFHRWEIQRHRLFESNVPLQGTSCDHRYRAVSVVGRGTFSYTTQALGYDPSIDEKRDAMGIDWMTRDELAEAIPPAYTEYIGWQLMDALALSPTKTANPKAPKGGELAYA